MRRRFLWFVLTFSLLTVWWLSACQAATLTAPASRPTPAGTITISVTRAPNGASTAQAANLKGSFVFAHGVGMIQIQDATGTNSRVLVPTKGDTLAQFPTFSPDGKQVAYSFNYFNQNGLIVQEIRAINIDGTQARTIIAPESPKIMLDLPAWSSDGQNIFFTQSVPIGSAMEQSTINRISITGGAPQKILDDGRLAAVSPDGKKIAFRRLDPKTYGSSLWIANSDGTEPKQLVGLDAFVDISAARFSPDSQSIVFAGSGEPKKPLPGLAYAAPTPDASCYVLIFFVCAIERASAHGLPSDLYLVDLAATKFTRLSRAGADSPYPAWSPDGRYIGFLSEIGIFVLDPQQKNLLQVSSQGGYGGFDWK